MLFRSLIQKGLLKESDMIAYLGGSYGEGGGTTFLEINKVSKVFSEYDKYELPNLETEM